jgi:adenine phosphoribosyltransferase
MIINQQKIDWLKSKIRDIPDFPKKGIIFKDLTTLLNDRDAFNFVVEVLTEHARTMKPDYIAGIEARGFILAPAVAHKLNIGFIPIRKPGKLPHTVEKISYDLEYGSNTLEIHVDAAEKGKRVLIIDDLLATGGTAHAACQLIERIGAKVAGMGFLVELDFLEGRQKLPKGVDTFSIIHY